MNNLKIYISGREADLADDEKILFTKEKTNFSNPTTVKNSFTKTLTLPGTKTNNEIFGSIWKIDRIQDDNFNPSKRAPFKLTSNGDLIETGYVKLDRVIYTPEIKYEVTLYGEIGNILYRLSNITESNQTRAMTLADIFSGTFVINRETVRSKWSNVFSDISFMVSYDGVPDAEKFEPTQQWVYATDRNIYVNWRETKYSYLPSNVTVDGTTYSTVNGYGLLELSKKATPLEMRDLRSYLLRPVIRVEYILDTLSSYLQSDLGYSLVLDDSFFYDEYRLLYMTLPMLYEIYPDISSNYTVNMKDILKKTPSPASFLISLCKIYNMYIDVDIKEKKITVHRMAYHYLDEEQEIDIDMSKEIKINPLPFEKSTYTFDYSDGEGENVKEYKETYEIPYGSMRVNTGYDFNNVTQKYIENNVFKTAADTIMQSAYFKCGYAKNYQETVIFPQGMMDNAEVPSYKLFNYDSNNSTYNYVDGEMTRLERNTSLPVVNIKNNGYQFLDSTWIGIRENVWQDSFQKLQFCNSENKGSDGSNVLVRYDGRKTTKWGEKIKLNSTFERKEIYSDEGVVGYYLTDDDPSLFAVTGKNGYVDRDQSSWQYGERFNSIPSFVRCPSAENDMIISMMDRNFNNILPSDNTVNITGGTYKFTTTIN